jgi:2-oxoacid:acceptor oxidoreductase delta subunit (pyruvate/2-ketoisovalerate family)
MGESLPVAPSFFASTDKRIAVVGAGPSGLACAYHLARLGHGVKVVEREREAGGMLRYGIPAFRLPRDVLGREIQRLVDMGIEFALGKPVPDATHMQSLRQDFDAVYLSIGAHRQKALGLGGQEISGLSTGLDYLKRASDGRNPSAGRQVIVIGGGNTAIDAARTALRFGSEVTLVHPGSREDMDAFEVHIAHACEEGVRLELMTEPVRILTAAGRVSGLVCRRLRPAGAGEAAGENATALADEEIDLSADSIIAATGERVDTSIIPSALHMEGTAIRTDRSGRTEWSNVFAGGDFIDEPRMVAHALAAGKRGAMAIDCMLRGESAEQVLDDMRVERSGPLVMSRYVARRLGSFPVEPSMASSAHTDRIVRFRDLNANYFEASPPSEQPLADPAKRLKDKPFAEYEAPLSEEALAGELARCFHCGRCTRCDNCYIYCPDAAISKSDAAYEIDLEHCKGCGICARECPRAAIGMKDEEPEF